MKQDISQLIKAGSTSVINALGEVMFSFALSLKLLKVTGSALGYGTSLIIGPIIGLLLAPLIGKLIDQFPHKKLALYSQLLLIVTLIIYLGAYTLLNLNILYTSIAVVIFINIFSRIFTITYLSSTPQIVSSQSIQRLNSIQTTGVAIASIVAAPVAGFLFGIIPFQMIILVEILTETLTLLLTWWTSFKQVEHVQKKISNSKKPNVDVWSILKAQPQLIVLTIAAMALNLIEVSFQIGIPFVLLHILKYSAAVSGNVQGVSSLGVFIGGLIITTITIKDVFHFAKRTYWISTLTILSLGLILKLIPQYTLILFVIFEFVDGFIGAISDPPVFTYIQQVIPSEALGRVNTIMYTMVQILNPVGVLIYSTLFSIFNYQTIYFFNGIVALVLVAMLFTQLKTNRSKV